MVATAIASIMTKHYNKLLSLWEMIERSLLVRKSPSATLFPDLDATLKALPGNDSLSKTKSKRWNLSDLGYFGPHLDRVYGEGEIVLVEKDVYYRNVILFIQRLQSFITFQGATLVKANIATSL